MHRSLLPLAIFLSGAAAAQSIEPVAGVATTSARQTNADDAAKSATTSADSSKQLCRRVSKQGSLVSRTQKICMTKQKWDEQVKQSQQMGGTNAGSSQSQCSRGYGSGYGSGAC